MTKMILVLIPILLCSCKQKNGLELLKDFNKKFTEFRSYEYSVNHQIYRSYSDKTVTREGSIYFEKNSDDSIVGYSYYYDKIRYPFHFICFYNGDKEINMRLNDSVAYFRDIKSLPPDKRINQPLIKESILSIEKWISNESISSKIQNLSVKDTFVNNTTCKLFSFNYSEVNYNWWNVVENGNNVFDVKIAFGSETGIPVYLYSKENIIDDTTQKPTGDYHLNKVFFSNFRAVKYPREKLTIENVPGYFHWGINRQKLEKSTLAPNFRLLNTKNEVVELINFRGKYVLLEFGFIGCGPCKASIPKMNEIAAKYPTEKLKVIGINLYCDNIKKVNQYRIENKIEYEFLMNDDENLIKDYKIESAPTLYLIDKNGQIIYSSNGLHDKELDFLLQKI
jgi:peroxiredoxin